MAKLVSVLFCLILTTQAVWAQSSPRVIEVSAVAEKIVDPDMVVLNVEVWSKANTAKLAQTLNSTEYTKAKKIFDQYKIKKEDIQTESYNVNPEYVWDTKTSQNKLVGFRANQSLRVTIRKIEEAGAFLDNITTSEKKNEAGVNVNSIAWDSSKKAEAEMAGLSDAVKVARKKAEEIAKSADVKIKYVQKISHFAGYETQTTSKLMSLKSGRSADLVAEAMPSSALNEGQIKVRVQVSAEFGIE